MFGVPKSRPYNALLAVHEGLLYGNNENQVGRLAIDRKTGLQRGVTHNSALAAHAQGVSVTRNEEQQSDFRMRQQILEGIQAMIARPIRYRQCPFIENGHETGWITLRPDQGVRPLLAMRL